MPLLYWSTDHPDQWVAYSKQEGWLQFPARANGWRRRTALARVNPTNLVELPPHRAFGTGFPGSADYYMSRNRAA